eukprot:13137281-Alexandrium_andersonii.AAC.1
MVAVSQLFAAAPPSRRARISVGSPSAARRATPPIPWMLAGIPMGGLVGAGRAAALVPTRPLLNGRLL